MPNNFGGGQGTVVPSAKWSPISYSRPVVEVRLVVLPCRAVLDSVKLEEA